MFLLLLPQIGDLQHCSLEILANYFFRAFQKLWQRGCDCHNFCMLCPELGQFDYDYGTTH